MSHEMITLKFSRVSSQHNELKRKSNVSTLNDIPTYNILLCFVSAIHALSIRIPKLSSLEVQEALLVTNDAHESRSREGRIAI